MKGSVLLPKIKIRDFTPVTTAGDYVERKKSLKHTILEQIPDIEKVKQKTLGKKLFLDIRFYLNAQTGIEGDTQKDLDNLLNAIFDVLPQYFTDEKNQLIDGLGLIEGKSDYMIFETLVSKQFVGTHQEEGFDIEISEMNEPPTKNKSPREWMDDKIFPKTNSKDIRITKWIAIWGIIASAIFTLTGVLMGIGMSFSTLGFSIQTDVLSSNASNQTNPVISNLASNLIENGNSFFEWGFVTLALGVIIVIFAIIRER